MLRRAFSIAGFRRVAEGIEISIIYRVVGTATRRMESLAEDDHLSVLGPLGNSFPVHSSKPTAWLVAGGVGLPAMLMLAEALHEAGKSAVAFYGAQSDDLIALTLAPSMPLSTDAERAVLAAAEFARAETPVIVSTDDGSLGFHGHVGAALETYNRANPIEPDDVVVYTCGPERMMRFVAEHCCVRGIECYVCMERAMACGTGTCQSCVVPLRDSADPEGWQYRLCCRDGPVFDARDILWDQPGTT